jgi:LmbE family N-acetylglucosaminyl deacetylase
MRHYLLTIIRLQALAAGLFQLVVMGAGLPHRSVGYISNSTPPQHDVFVVAHQDDWQVFMGDIVARRIKAGDSATFIYLTAGDDGRDSLYWQARERAALQSTRLAVGVDAVDSAAVRCSTTEALTHAIHKCVIANTESYFLRLPDGKRNGAGFARHGYQSLRKLRGKRIAAITAIDGSAAYLGWGDLIATASILVGSSPITDIVVHTSDPSITANPHDHFDHRMTGLLVNDLRKRQKWNTQYYVGYALATRAANRSTDQAREKTAIFLAYDKEMMRVNKAWSAYGEHPAFYSECMVRTYARKARSSGGR